MERKIQSLKEGTYLIDIAKLFIDRINNIGRYDRVWNTLENQYIYDVSKYTQVKTLDRKDMSYLSSIYFNGIYLNSSSPEEIANYINDDDSNVILVYNTDEEGNKKDVVLQYIAVALPPKDYLGHFEEFFILLNEKTSMVTLTKKIVIKVADKTSSVEITPVEDIELRKKLNLIKEW